MTRATLLRLLAHPTALNGADVRALEELAEAFPYCQTAHLLLAKAAHDHGSMLAGQRLRRAATYATDRALLRQLLETPSAEPTLEPAIAAATVTRSAGLAEDFAELPPAPPAEASPAEPPYSLLLTDQPAQEIVPAPQAKTPSAPEAALLANEPATDATKLLLPPAAPEVPNVPDASASHPEATTEPANEAYLVPPVAVETAEAPLSAELAVEVVEFEPQFTVAELTAEASTANEVEPAPSEVAAGLAELSVAEATASPGELATAFDATEAPSEEVALSETVLPTETSQDATAPTPDAAADPDELPAEAPPIRLPAEAEAASQEFGLATAEPAEVTAYQLPELELDITVPLAPAVATPRLPAFSGVPDVAYAPDEGSRYGFCLVAVAEAGEPLVPAASLPPTGEFFLPDALLLAHLAAPPELPTSTTTDLINSFLQRATGAVRRRAISAAASPQSDLSVRSTRATPDLASESLASILARQGKVEQAIAVYERLMVKIPEKSAIFAAEIEALRPSA